MKTNLDFVNEYLDYLMSLRQSLYTIKNSRSHLLRFIAFLKTCFELVTPHQINPDHLKTWQIHLSGLYTPQGHPLKASSINGQIRSVRNFISYLAQNGIVSHHLTETLVLLKTPKVLPQSVLTHAQVKRFLSRIATDSTLGSRNRAMFEVLYSTGIRAGELLALDVSDVDFKSGTILVQGKGDKQRVVPVGKTALRYLESYVKAVRPFQLKEKSETALFLNIDGNRLKYGSFTKIVTALKANTPFDDVTAHTFRRSCTTELLRAGANIYHVKDFLGHESLDTLEHYAKLSITDLKKTHAKCHPREKDNE